ncbi:MAG: MBL fold metallo-hydrolase RNA specificity domain-containing protein [Bacteroidia bacterium]
MKVKFIGATETVTGSEHLIITEKGRKILLDCGLYQGMGKETDVLNRNLGINPNEIEAVILSHAHIDHSGKLPYLIKRGFKGKIYCTPATRDVCEVLLMDSARIHESDIKFINKRRKKNNLEPIEPLYTSNDAERCLKHLKSVPYDGEFQLNDEISFHFTDVGHIIGAASVHVTSHENGKTTKLSFTGDVGRYNDLLLKKPTHFCQADYIICESTYGDRLHEPQANTEEKLLKIVLDTCIERKGKLIIPSFSLGRTQEIIFILNKLYNEKRLPQIKVYVDSPLSSKATEIVKLHPECFNQDLKEYILRDADPFGFPGLKFIEESEDSKALNFSKEPCIIISASGMADAGRVKHHIMFNVGDEKNTILIVGYCSPRTLGANLEAGHEQVRIFGEEFTVKAKIASIHSLSAHGDYSEIIRLLSSQDKKQVKKIFLVHGEDEAKISFREKLEKEGFSQVEIPGKDVVFNLD